MSSARERRRELFVGPRLRVAVPAPTRARSVFALLATGVVIGVLVAVALALGTSTVVHVLAHSLRNGP